MEHREDSLKLVDCMSARRIGAYSLSLRSMLLLLLGL